jgi:hypothetical protein
MGSWNSVEEGFLWGGVWKMSEEIRAFPMWIVWKSKKSGEFDLGEVKLRMFLHKFLQFVHFVSLVHRWKSPLFPKVKIIQFMNS